MDHMEYDDLMSTIQKLEAVLDEQGFPKGTVQVAFNPKSMDEKILSLAASASEAGAPIKTDKVECHFGGCGIICCTF